MVFFVVLVASLIVSSFFGHVIHWALHQRWTGPAHEGHLEHHVSLYPPARLTTKKYLAAKWYHSGPLLFTPPFIVILGGAWLTLHTLAIPHWVALTFGLTMLGFALSNDYLHDAFHVEKHWLWRFAWFERIRALHYVHHKHMRKNYGIVTLAWDRVFGTLRPSR